MGTSQLLFILPPTHFSEREMLNAADVGGIPLKEGINAFRNRSVGGIVCLDENAKTRRSGRFQHLKRLDAVQRAQLAHDFHHTDGVCGCIKQN